MNSPPSSNVDGALLSRGRNLNITAARCVVNKASDHSLPDINRVTHTSTPWRPLPAEVEIHGARRATEIAEDRFLKDAFQAICDLRLKLYHRSAAPRHLAVPIEWAILGRDVLVAESTVWARFAQCLVLIALNLLGRLDDSRALELLKDGESDVLNWSRSVMIPKPLAAISDGLAQPTYSEDMSQLHYISLLRCLLEFSGGREDSRQRKIDPRYTASENANFCGSILGVTGSNPFGNLSSEETLETLCKSNLFTNLTTTQDLVQLNMGIMACVQIGFPDGYLGLPAKVLCNMECAQLNMVRVQIADLRSNVPALRNLEDDVLVFLACTYLFSSLPQVANEWAASDEGRALRHRLIKSIQISQPSEMLGLILAALLGYTLLLCDGHANTETCGAYLFDFDAILIDRPRGDDRNILVRMMLSMQRIFAASEDVEYMYRFLATVLDIETPILAAFDGISDQYWAHRMKGLPHMDALGMAWPPSPVIFPAGRGAAGPHVPASDLTGQFEVIAAACSVSAKSTYCCDHPRVPFRTVEGFKVSRVLLEIQLHDRYFNITIDALATSWVGRWILLRNGFLLRALLAGRKRSQVKPFRLADAPRGRYTIEGGCCPDPGELCLAELEECNLGRMLVAEKTGEWRRVFAFNWRRFAQCLRTLLCPARAEGNRKYSGLV